MVVWLTKFSQHKRVTTFGLNSGLAEKVGLVVCLFARQDRGGICFAISLFPLLLLRCTTVVLLDFLLVGLGGRFAEPISVCLPFSYPSSAFFADIVLTHNSLL